MDVARPSLPETVYAFVNRANPMVWHNYELIGSLISVSVTPGWDDSSEQVLPYIANPNSNLTFVSPFLVSSLAPWGVELDAERVRRVVAPGAPSRLSCIYAFGSLADCEKASHLYGWPLEEVRPFQIASGPATRIARVNMQIVSLARAAYSRGGLDPDSVDALWRAYWSGESNMIWETPLPPPNLRGRIESGCLWEYLIHGRLQKI
jgi:hypothetical protein